MILMSNIAIVNDLSIYGFKTYTNTNMKNISKDSYVAIVARCLRLLIYG